MLIGGSFPPPILMLTWFLLRSILVIIIIIMLYLPLHSFNQTKYNNMYRCIVNVMLLISLPYRTPLCVEFS